jgi:hypothetical protein
MGRRVGTSCPGLVLRNPILTTHVYGNKPRTIVASADLELSPDDLRELNTAASKIAVQGARYPEELQKMVGR